MGKRRRTVDPAYRPADAEVHYGKEAPVKPCIRRCNNAVCVEANAFGPGEYNADEVFQGKMIRNDPAYFRFLPPPKPQPRLYGEVPGSLEVLLS